MPTEPAYRSLKRTLSALRAEGWEIGSYWSHPGACGHYIRHAERNKGR